MLASGTITVHPASSIGWLVDWCLTALSAQTTTTTMTTYLKHTREKKPVIQ